MMAALLHVGSMKATRIVLGSLLLIISINALGGGWYGMAGAPNVPKEWLAGSPFSDYFVPALILFVFVGIHFFIGAMAVLRKNRYAVQWAYSCAAVLFTWIVLQVAIIGYVSWLQPAMAVAAVVIFLLAHKLSRG